MATILCIEDEDVLRQCIAEVLEDEGYDVLQAGDGQQGLQEIMAHKPDLVVCDITMPGKDGYQLLQEVRGTSQAFAKMPFLFLSALAGRKDVLDGLKRGADDYLTKPVDFELLTTKIAACLRQVDRIQVEHDAYIQNSWFLE